MLEKEQYLPTISARYDRLSMGAYLVGAVFIGIAGWVLIKTQVPWTFGQLGGWFFLAFAPVLGLWIGACFLDRRVVLLINDDGVLDRRSVDRLVPWSEIRDMEQWRLGLNAFHYLDIGGDVGRFTDNLPKRLLLRLNQAFGNGIVINTEGLDISFDRVDRLLARRLGKKPDNRPR